MTQRRGLRIVIEGADRPLQPALAIDLTLAVIAILRHFFPDLTLRLERDPRADEDPAP